MQCVADNYLEDAFDLDETEVAPDVDAFVSVFTFTEALTFDSTLYTYAVTVASSEAYNGAIWFAESPFGLCAESRYSARGQNIEGARACFNNSWWLTRVLGNFVLDAMGRANNTAYQAERSGMSPSTATGLASFQLGGEVAAGSALANGGGMVIAQGLGGLTTLIPAAAGVGTAIASDLPRNAPFTAAEKAAIAASDALNGMDSGRQLVNTLADALSRRGYSPDEIVKMLKSLQGGIGL